MLGVENFHYAVSQLAQTTMRNIVGSVTLDELLTGREQLSLEICKIVDEATDSWGIKVQNVELKDVALPGEMKRVIAKVAEAEREKQSVITKSEGQVEASQNLAKAAEIIVRNINESCLSSSLTVLIYLKFSYLEKYVSSRFNLLDTAVTI